MKRVTATAVAVATALTLVANPAFAEEPTTGQESSSELSDQDAFDYANEKSDQLTGLVRKAAEKKTREERENAFKPLISSVKSDAAQGWAPGTTANVLLGTGITAALLAVIAIVANSGLVPGLPLPF